MTIRLHVLSYEYVYQKHAYNCQPQGRGGGVGDIILIQGLVKKTLPLPNSDSLSLEDKAALEAHCLKLEKSGVKLRIENDQLKEVAEVARQQGTAMEMWQKSHDLEVGALRQQLLDLEMQSDSDARSAVLHRQMIALQIGGASTTRKLEGANARILSLEASLLKSEQERDGCVEAVSRVRAECHSKVKHLRTVVQVLVFFTCHISCSFLSDRLILLTMYTFNTLPLTP